MSAKVERAIQIARLEQHLQTGAAVVWNKPEFPAAHRPDIRTLTRPGKIRIGNPRQTMRVHPHLKPEIARDLKAQLQQIEDRRMRTQPSWYDFYANETTFAPRIVGLPDEELRMFVYHEAAHSVDKPKRTPHDQYTEGETVEISLILAEAFMPTKPKTLEQTSLLKASFRRMLEVDGQFVTDINHAPEVMLLSEIYPTAFELITDRIVRNGGDINAFDTAAAQGKIKPSGKEDHPRFSAILYKALQFIDWRYLLDAFKTGDIDQTIALLSQHAVAPAEGSGIFMELLEAIKEDEQQPPTRRIRINM